MEEQKVELVEPCKELREAYIDYVKESQASGEPFHQNEIVEIYEHCGDFVQNVKSRPSGIGPLEQVPGDTYWLVREGQILAISRLRHQLTKALEE